MILTVRHQRPQMTHQQAARVKPLLSLAGRPSHFAATFTLSPSAAEILDSDQASEKKSKRGPVAILAVVSVHSMSCMRLIPTGCRGSCTPSSPSWQNVLLLQWQVLSQLSRHS